METKQLRLYYARIYEQNEDIYIYADFENKLKLMFDKTGEINYKEKSSLFIHRLDFVLKKEADEQLYLQLDGELKPVKRFSLQGTHRVLTIGSVTHLEKHRAEHPLANYIGNKYNFLFDIEFDSKFAQNFPGKNTDGFINLCLYTCYLLHEKTFDFFPILFEQFQVFLSNQSDPYKDFDFNEFFKYCERLLPVALDKSEETFQALQIVLRMIGLVSIPTGSFNDSNKSSIDFACEILHRVNEQFNALYELVDKDDRPLFDNGLVTLLCIKLIDSTRQYSRENHELAFLQTLTEQIERQQIANQLLKLLGQLNYSIVGSSDWAILFTMVDPAEIEIQHLILAKSLKALTQCLDVISEVLVDFENFKELFRDYLEERLTYKQFEIDLDGLSFLVKFLENNPNQNEFLTYIQETIEKSNKLAEITKDYFHDLKINDSNMKLVSQIFTRIYKHQFLQSVDIFKTFDRSLTPGKHIQYYLRWFECFLAKGDVWRTNENDLNARFDYIRRKIILHWNSRSDHIWRNSGLNSNPNPRLYYFFEWMRQAVVSTPTLFSILKSTDRLVNSFDLSTGDDEFQVIFIDKLAHFCFQFLEDIYQTIENALLSIQNEFFRVKFTKRYQEIVVSEEKVTILKEFTNDRNPLAKLIVLDRKSQYKSLLIHDLIEALCELIEITKDELLKIIFDKAKGITLIYNVLMEESFSTIPIREQIIKDLLSIWTDWETDNFQIEETQIWIGLKPDKRQIICDIWERIGEIVGKNISFESLITEADRKFQTVLNIRNNIKKCILHYCTNSPDLKHYIDLISKLDENVNQRSVETFQLPDELIAIQDYTKYLNTFIESNAWRNFLKQQLESNDCYGIHIEQEERTCHDQLKVVSNVFDRFIEYLSYMCSTQDEPIFPELQNLFPEKQLVDKELSIMKLVIVGRTFSRLEILLGFWKNRDQIINFSKGCISLCLKYDIEIENTLTILQSIIDMNDSTTVNACITIYQKYSNEYLNKYDESMCQLISHWNLSNDLLTFLYSFTKADEDDLLEVVNDWDEASMNTTTILDFIKLTRSISTLNTKMETIQTGKTLTFDDIINCLQEIAKDNGIENLLSSFESCSKNLGMIQHMHSESKSKEQSKKQRILDIINNGQLCFSLLHSEGTIHLYNYQFDVHTTTTNNNWDPISFVDLNDLRDRAKLVQYAQDNGNDLQNYSKHDIEQLELFISLVDTIEEILQNFRSLYTSGYPIAKQYSMHQQGFTCQEGNFDELKEFKKTLTEQLDQWGKELCARYRKCLNLTYLSYQQLSIIEEAIRNQEIAQPTHMTYHLFKFMGVDPTSIGAEVLANEIKTPSDLLKNIVPVLQSNYDNEGFSAVENEKIDKIFLIETTDSGILRAILSLFHLNENSRPMANQLFYCTRSTTWTEIRAFAYRCFYSQMLHQLIRPELLSIIIQDRLAQLLIELINQSPKHRFRLGIITNILSLQLYLSNSLKSHSTVRTFRDQELLNEETLTNTIKELIGNRCMIVTSKISGLSKSFFIRKEIERREKQQVKFSINGDMSVDILMQRLRDERIQSPSSPIALHIDIGPTENVEQLNEFLYSLILFRCFRFNQTSVDIPVEIPIFIELDSSPFLNSLLSTIVIFKYIQRHHIESMDWSELDNTSSDIQLVANYLRNICDKTIDEKEVNDETISFISQSECILLLDKHFPSTKKIKFISWTQLSIFIAVYYNLFHGFSNSGYFCIGVAEKSSTVRLDILTSLLESAGYFTSFSVEAARQNQRAAQNNETTTSTSDTIIRWDNALPFTVIFTHSYDPLFVFKQSTDIPQSVNNAFRSYFQRANKPHSKGTIVKRKVLSAFKKRSSKMNAEAANVIELTKVAETELQKFLINPSELSHEQLFLRLASLSTKYLVTKSTCLACYKQCEYDSEKCPSCSNGGSLIRPDKSGTSAAIKQFQTDVALKLKSEYILTADNYIKMLLIYLRVESGLPVLIMGETGCGKTALIQFLCQRVLSDEMFVFRIHAGVTNDQIVDKMNEYTEKARNLLNTDENKRVWVFFDEFNTTPNIGLLKEIVCDRTLLGESLPENMVFLGACNPLRRQTKTKGLQSTASVKRYSSKMQHQIYGETLPLLHSVVPIPETMLEHVWDYGHLDKEIEKKYIETMLNACKLSLENKKWLRHLVIMISESQDYIRRCEDVSSVSLRDVSRFCRFYKQFYETSDAIEENTEAVTTKTFNRIERASLLALFLCYYFRLNSADKRTEYLNLIAKYIEKYNSEKPFGQLDAMLQEEKAKLIKRMKLPPGTAANRALTDNIFVLYTCILNRIPVILCGKPGCSKTSAVQIVISNLRGKNSEDSVLKSKSELIAISYQGSQNCTSDSIIKVFERADRYANKNKQTNLLPVIVFDEIGLAELSPHNPLKVLHSELEVETCRHAFVGLSNWRLDASKMNRAVYLACPEPNFEDLKVTATTLAQSMAAEVNQANPLDETTVEALARVYEDVCACIEKDRNQQYFGLRDYYSLIKGIVRDLLQSEDKEANLYRIVRHHLSCNFDDIIDGSEFMWKRFCHHMQNDQKIHRFSPPTFTELLHHSLSLLKGRFLMLIGNGEITFDYVQRYINTKYPSIQTKTLIGSTFEDDFLSTGTYTEKYNTRVLMDIILYAEKEITLFLRGLGHLYDNLYDLFNQSYAVSAEKKYCRIALGSLYHPRCLVNDKFYCVVFAKAVDLDKYDAPFLNRFEKHFIDLDSLTDQQHRTVVSKLIKWMNQLFSNEKLTNTKDFFIWSTQDYLRNLVSEAFDYLKQSDAIADDENVFNYCQNQILRVSSFDLPLLLSLEAKPEFTQIVQQYYTIHTNLSLSSFVQKEFKEQKNNRLLIYTFTEIYGTIQLDCIDNHDSWIKVVRLSEFRTEYDLMKKFKQHNLENSESLLCIRIDYYREHEYIPILKYLLLNTQSTDVKLGICLIFHLQRCQLTQIHNDIFFDGWSRIMIDDLDKNQIIPEAILANPSYGILINHLNFFDLEKRYDELISGCIIKLNYTVTNRDDELKINDRRDTIIKQFTTKPNSKDQSLYSCLKTHLIDMTQKTIMNTNQSQFNDWRQDLIANGIVNGSSRSFNEALMKTIHNYLDSYLSMFFIHLEKYSLIDSFLFLSQSNQQIQQKLLPIWRTCWDMAVKKAIVSPTNEEYTNIPLVFDLHLPCAMIEYDIIHKIRQNIAQIQLNNDNEDHDSQKLINTAYKQLNSSSIYGKLIDDILTDSDLCTHYYHDQLTLTRNEASAHHLSTSFIQRLLSSDMSTNSQRLLQHLFINYEELFEIMKLFEISRILLNNEEDLLKLLTQQLIFSKDEHKTILQNNTSLYSLVSMESNFYLVPPNSTDTSNEAFESLADPFIETCLMNSIELLVSLYVVQSIDNIEQMITTYNLFTQCINRLIFYGRYDIKNLEKLKSVLRLATCISNLFPPEQALQILKQGYTYFNSNDLLCSREQIDRSIGYLKKIINEQKSSKDDKIVEETLVNFETELVTNWFMDNSDQYNDVLEFINKSQKDLWAYSARIFTLIDRSLGLSVDIQNTDGNLTENEQYDQINQYLSQVNDPTGKIEILLNMRVYTRLVLDEDYKPYMMDESQEQIMKILKDETKFNTFKTYLNEISDLQNTERLDLISRIAWLKYYLLYYVYALKHDIQDKIMEEINEILARDIKRFYSTVKLYIIKQLCQCENITFNDLCDRYANRRCTWICLMNMKKPTILPLPLFESTEEFQRIDKQLSSLTMIDEMKSLIRECSENQRTFYCFLVWFIRHYTRFYHDNVNPDERFLKLLESQFSVDFANHLGLISERFILALCTNFTETSFFHLRNTMSEEDLHQRLVILNMVALLISFKCNKNDNAFSYFLFNKENKYVEHFEKLSYLTGFAFANDSALQQMLHIRTQINRHHGSRIDIYRCSRECSWFFYFEDSRLLDEHRTCPLCKKETAISTNGNSFVMNRPHVPFNQNDILNFIDEYINNHKYKDYLKFEDVPSSHLNQPITFHFMNLLTNSVFLFLHEFDDYLPGHTPAIYSHFKKSVENHYTAIQTHLSNAKQDYFWFYKLFNHILESNIKIENDPLILPKQSAIEFEETIEKQLIIPRIKCVTKEIRDYKLSYLKFLNENQQEDQLLDFVEELNEDDERYPLLRFFNSTNIHSLDIIRHFHSQLQLQPNYQKTYPLSAFLFRRINDYDNIPHLYSFIKFTNYLIQNFNSRIERENARTTKIAEFLENHKELQNIYKKFEKHWFKITLKDVYFNQQKYQWTPSTNQENFSRQTNISMFLLNKSNTNESLLPIACLHTIANLQNEILDYFHSNVINDKTQNENNIQHTIPLQSIQQKHLYDFDLDRLRSILFEIGLMINYQYGMSDEIIYNFDEIEWTLRNEISCLPKIDLKNIRYFNYQFELYDENLSLINDIRQRFDQKLFDQQRRTQLKTLLSSLDNNSSLEISGSLEYILKYLQNVNNQKIVEEYTIERFIREDIHSNSCIDEKYRREIFTTIHLAHIIDLYELNEECIFDKILAKNIRQELCEEAFFSKERTKIVEEFIATILNNTNFAQCFKELDVWIGMFKRLLVRLLLPKINIHFESSLYDYIKRTDMWKGNITTNDIKTIEIKDDLRLKHGFIILKGLENKIKQQKLIGMKPNQTPVIEHSDEDKGDDEEKNRSSKRTSKQTSTVGKGQGPKTNLRLGLRPRRT